MLLNITSLILILLSKYYGKMFNASLNSTDFPLTTDMVSHRMLALIE